MRDVVALPVGWAPPPIGHPAGNPPGMGHAHPPALQTARIGRQREEIRHPGVRDCRKWCRSGASRSRW